MKIGNVELETPVFLAPMAGYTDLPFRLMAKKYGAGLVFTEMVSAKGLYYGDRKTPELMMTAENERPTALQLFGSDPAVIGQVIKTHINKTPFALLDFNAGCPAPKIVKNGDGSALMKNPQLLGRIVTEIKKSSAKPFTVKIRLGWDADHINVLEVAEIIAEAGADAITIHGRTRADFYAGEADWSIIAKVKKHLSIPVILNGDVRDGDSAVRAFETTGCDGIMVGRGAIGNPFIFDEITHRINTGENRPSPTPRQRLEAAIEHLNTTTMMAREDVTVKGMRKHLAAYTKGLKHSTELRQRIFKLTTRQEVIAVLSEYLRLNYGTELES